MKILNASFMALVLMTLGCGQPGAPAPESGVEAAEAEAAAKGAEAEAAAEGAEAEAAEEGAEAEAAAEGEGEKAPLQVGGEAPEVSFAWMGGGEKRLADYKGQQVLVYFYPKDDTPGCTAEAQGFRDLYADFEAAKVAIVGVSKDDEASHQAFIDKYELPFPLVTNGEAVAEAFQVPTTAFGGFARVSFLIGADGKIAEIWPQVGDAAGHAREVLDAVSAAGH